MERYNYVFEFYYTQDDFLKGKKYRAIRKTTRFINKHDKEGLKSLLGFDDNIYSFSLLYIDKIEEE
ncbi:hypothetical protein [uncultured Lactococcus sp.]|uniref:hypothetical protein n=1 Tax=uncultured Lactococcus sp. TaxID=167973 RepID=UPI0027DD9D73|nr:hypothetical protein [uncultured Lactococcus sp.]